MSSSLACVYNITKTFLVENFKFGWKNDMAINMASFFRYEEI